jgi:hypothetical protein
MHATWTVGLLISAFAAAVPWGAWEEPARGRTAPAASDAVTPRYGADRALQLPANYREWVFVGSSLGLSYDAAPDDHEMFHETLMEPTAYRHFVATGEFREGTMLVLMLHGTETGVLPGRRGRFAGEIHGVEMAVKDKTRTPEGWAYYGFGGMGGTTATSAQPAPANACFSCHKQHAARDNVFLQFYPLLAEAAKITVPIRRANDAPAAPHARR